MKKRRHRYAKYLNDSKNLLDDGRLRATKDWPIDWYKAIVKLLGGRHAKA